MKIGMKSVLPAVLLLLVLVFSTTYVALLRGINVGGKNMLPMKDLIAMFEAAKCDNVRAYIQSGNILFQGTQKIADGLPKKIAARYWSPLSQNWPRPSSGSILYQNTCRSFS